MLIRELKYIKNVVLFRLFGLFRSISPNAKKIKNLKDTKIEKRCFITATGPSLTSKDLEMLKDEDTFGVNSIFLMYDKTDWRPTYYVCTDAPYFKKLVDSYGITPDMLCKQDIFLNSQTRKLNPSFKEDKIHWISFSGWNRAYDFYKPQIMDDISHGMFAFGTVTNIVIAIAMYMGYKEIYLIGADCSNLNQHFVNDVTDKDKDDAYVKKVIHAQLAGYEIMKKETEKRGVGVYNVTRGGALEVFPRKDLDVVLDKQIFLNKEIIK